MCVCVCVWGHICIRSRCRRMSVHRLNQPPYACSVVVVFGDIRVDYPLSLPHTPNIQVMIVVFELSKSCADCFSCFDSIVSPTFCSHLIHFFVLIYVWLARFRNAQSQPPTHTSSHAQMETNAIQIQRWKWLRVCVRIYIECCSLNIRITVDDSGKERIFFHSLILMMLIRIRRPRKRMMMMMIKFNLRQVRTTTTTTTNCPQTSSLSLWLPVKFVYSYFVWTCLAIFLFVAVLLLLLLKTVSENVSRFYHFHWERESTDKTCAAKSHFDKCQTPVIIQINCVCVCDANLLPCQRNKKFYDTRLKTLFTLPTT